MITTIPLMEKRRKGTDGLPFIEEIGKEPEEETTDEVKIPLMGTVFKADRQSTVEDSNSTDNLEEETILLIGILRIAVLLFTLPIFIYTKGGMLEIVCLTLHNILLPNAVGREYRFGGGSGGTFLLWLNSRYEKFTPQTSEIISLSDDNEEILEIFVSTQPSTYNPISSIQVVQVSQRLNFN
uniref:Uncharacterized protein n=1 Tax=Glossina palpalis gambiensis TaxID=67801 RepID=A0A1B0BL27_9MUSC